MTHIASQQQQFVSIIRLRSAPRTMVLTALLMAAAMIISPAIAQTPPPGRPPGARMTMRPVSPTGDAITRNVGIVVHEGVELLDFAGPGEVFELASRYGGIGSTLAYRVFTVAPSKEQITSQNFLRITPEFSIKDCPKIDILIIPGGRTGNLLNDAPFMSWVATASEEAEITMSVCTGAFVLSQIGALDGRKATTHSGSVVVLEQRTPKAEILRNARFVDTGDVITTAGISAGIDGSLHLVARLNGIGAAQQTAQFMEYDWQPRSEDRESYPSYNPLAGRRAQLIAEGQAALNAQDWDTAITAYRELTEANENDGFAWFRLGFAMHGKGEVRKALRIHEKAARLTRGQTAALARYNIACAHALLGETDKAIEALGEAVRYGFRNVQHMGVDTDLDSIREDERFIEIIDRLSGGGRTGAGSGNGGGGGASGGGVA